MSIIFGALLKLCGKRQVPCTPDKFKAELEKREEQCKAKKVNLFTSGGDYPFVQAKYRETYNKMARTKVWNFSFLELDDQAP